MRNSKVRHRFALDGLNQLVEIHDAQYMSGLFYCPYCKMEMIMRCGEKNAWHFAHKHMECEYDKYLHSVAIRRICDWYNRSSEIALSLPIIEKCIKFNDCSFYNLKECQRETISDPYNLKKWFSSCEKEKQITRNGQRFVADLLCSNNTNDQDPLFIEICVSHPCEDKKIQSGIRIIELIIENESDIDDIISGHVKITATSKIKFYNFYPKPKVVDNPQISVFFQRFILFPSGKACVDRMFPCKEGQNRRGIFELTIKDDECVPLFINFGGFYSVAFALASSYVNDLKSCSLCKYQAYNEWNNCYICKLYRKFDLNKLCSENNPLTCPYFKRDEVAIKERIEEFKKFEENFGTDIWVKTK